VAEGAGVSVRVAVAVKVGVNVGVKVGLAVGGTGVGVSVGGSIVTEVPSARNPQNDGRSPGEVTQAVRNDKITRHKRMLLKRMGHSDGSNLIILQSRLIS